MPRCSPATPADAGVFSRPAQDAAAHEQVAGMATGGALNPPPGQAFSEGGRAKPGVFLSAAVGTVKHAAAGLLH